MGLAAATLWTVGTLVLLTTAASMEDGDLPALSGPCSATLAPEGPCELDKDECPFVFNLPPMTVNLPKKLMELERLVEELQLLKDNVDELRRMCKDCAVSQSERACGGEAEHETSKHSEDGVWINGNPESKNADKTIWERDSENNKKVLSEDGKSLEVEQVAAAGKNVRITAGKKLDRKQIDGREKGVLDKLLKKVGNGSQSQKNKTIGKSEILRDKVIDRKKQIEAGDGGEKIREEFEIDHQLPISISKAEQEDMLKKKEETIQSRDSENTDASDYRIWPDKHHEVDHEKVEKNYSNINKSEEEPIDSHGPYVWHDKSQVDKNQMQTRRYGDGIEESGKTRISNQKEKNTQSGRHVWPDETVESGIAGRIKLPGEEGGDRGQDPGEIDGNNKKAKLAEGEKMNYQQPSLSNPNENLEHSNIDELVKVEKQPRTTAPTIDDVVQEDRKNIYKLPLQTFHKGTDTKHSSVAVQSAKNTSKLTKASHTTSNSHFTTNSGQRKTTSGPPSQAEREKPIKNIGRELKRPAQKHGEVKNSRVMEGTDLGSLSQPSVINSRFIDLEQAFTLTSPPAFTASHSTTDVKPGQRKSVQNNEMGGSNEHLRTDAESGGDEDYKMESAEENIEIEYDQMEQTVWPSKKEQNMDKRDKSGQRNPTKTELNATSSPAIVSNSDITTDAKQGYQKINDQQPSQSSQSENLEHSNIDELDKIEKTAPTNRDVVQGERKTTYKPPSQTIKNEKMIVYSSMDVQSAKNTSKLTTTIGQQKTTSEPTSKSNQDEKDSKTMHSHLNEQLTKILIESGKTVSIDMTSASPSASKSHFAIALDQVRQKTSEEQASPNNYNKMDIKTEGSHVYIHLTKNATQPTKDSTSSAATDAKSNPTTTSVKQGQQKTPSQSHQDEDSESLGLETQSSKATRQPQTNVLDEDANISTPGSHVTTNLEKANEKFAKRPTSQSNQDKKQSEGSGLDAQSAKATSQPNLEKRNQKIAKRPTSQSNQDENDSDDILSKTTSHSKTSALAEDITISTPTVSKSQFTTDVKKEHGKLTNSSKSQSNHEEKAIENMHSVHDANSIPSQATNVISEVTTSSTPTDTQKSPYRPSGKENEKDSNSGRSHFDLQLSKVRGQPTGSVFMDNISSTTVSTTTLRNQASFKDEIPSTTYMSHQISPTTTSPPTTNNRLAAKMNMSKKTTQAKVGMKPEANQKLKNAKNDRKPDTKGKGDQRQKPVTRPKMTPGKALQPVQIPKYDQSAQSHTFQVRGNVTDNQLPSAVPAQKSQVQTPTLLPRLMEVNATIRMLTDEGHNASIKHIDRHSEVDEKEKTHRIKNEGTNNERPKQFIKKIGQNVTSGVMQNRSTDQFNGTKDRLPGQSIPKNPKLNQKVPKINQKSKPAQVPKVKPVHPKMEAGQITKVKPKLEQASKAKIPKPIADSKNSSRVPPGQKTPTKPLKSKVIPASKTKPPLKPKSRLSTDMVPTPGPIKLTTEWATEFKSTTLNAKTTPDLEALDNHKVLEGSTLSTNSRIIYNGGSQTTSQAPSFSLTTLENKVIQASTTSNSDSSQQEKEQDTNQDRITITAPRVHSRFRSTTSGPKAPAAEATTPSARELRVKINQVAAFLNKSNTHSHGRGLDLDKQNTDRTNPAIKPGTMLTRDCSDHMLRGHTKSGVYLVRPDPSIGSFHVFCELEVDGGGWTVLQIRQDGSVSFNRSWAEYREGFGQLDRGEFWLGNTYIHLLTRVRPMELRVELEDFEGIQEYAQYQLFKVASERLRYRLSVDGYSGTAGDALRFSSKYDHNNRAFTTPDRDNDRYPSGNCGAYYSSGWWFDACMAANLNGRYYMGRYKGVRDGIYWGTWQNISSEYYPTNDRLSFKTVRMMIRPQGFKP